MQLHRIVAGHYWTDSGAFMGVLPYTVWHDKIKVDERQRVRLELNLLLIQTEGRNILVDTGLGNRFYGRQRDIYNPSDFLVPENLHKLGLSCSDITDVILTHLHFDHAGGIVTQIEGKDELTFPQAIHWIQAEEWQMAKQPDSLNRAAYKYEHQLALLDQIGKIKLIEGDSEPYKNVFIKLVRGHTVGSQAVEVQTETAYYSYAGDIIPTRFHTVLPVISAYDVSRTQTWQAKNDLYDRLRAKGGILLLNHETDDWQVPIASL